jgi:hypothetical protein
MICVEHSAYVKVISLRTGINVCPVISIQSDAEALRDGVPLEGVIVNTIAIFDTMSSDEFRPPKRHEKNSPPPG